MVNKYLYKYVLNEEIIYIGRTDNIYNRINQHKSDLPENCKIYIGICPNTACQMAFEILLIDHYRPHYNKQFIYIDEPIFESDSLWEPEWIDYEVFIKEKEALQKKEKIQKSEVSGPSKYQIDCANQLYDSYIIECEKLVCDSIWKCWTNYVSEKKDYCCKVDVNDSLPKPFSEHEYSDEEIIPWNVIDAWMTLEAYEIIERYKKYVKYAEQRGINPQPCVYEFSFVDNKNLYQLKDLQILLDNYIYDVCSVEREEERRQEQERRKYEQQLRVFVKMRQPIYIKILFDEKDKYKKYGCGWDVKEKKWYISEKTWLFFKNPMMFFNRMFPEEVDVAIKEGLLSEEQLSKNARVAYKVYEHNKNNDGY